jgi:hypothetical protein
MGRKSQRFEDMIRNDSQRVLTTFVFMLYWYLTTRVTNASRRMTRWQAFLFWAGRGFLFPD